MIAALLCALAPHLPATLDGWLTCRGAPQEGEWIVHGDWQFDAAGLDALDLTGDELAKLHLRHLVGGRSPLARDERIFRFEFPERPVALVRFLATMSPEWNISLFHYRNHGSDVGRVLVGMQVPDEDRDAFAAFLHRLGYAVIEETNKPAYALFLR